MKRTTRLVFVCLAGATLALALRVALAQDHPEHPKKGSAPKAGAHPDKPAAKAVTLDEMARAIQDYVQEDTRIKGGYFLLYDAQDKRPLVLTLEKVHKDQVAELEKGVYFACADFKSNDGVAYDLDFLMKPSDQGLKCTEIHVHKVSGKPRYDWYQDEKDGLWKRRPSSAAP